MSARTAASKAVDWTKVTTKLGLGQNTLSGLSAFRKRNTDARDKVNQLESQKQTVDFDFYRSVLKNQAIVREVEGSFKGFKPKTYDVAAQIKAIEQFEAKAVEGAQQTEKSIDKELSDLQETLKNIESARPFEELTVEDVMRARPDIAKNVETMVTKGYVGCSTRKRALTKTHLTADGSCPDTPTSLATWSSCRRRHYSRLTSMNRSIAFQLNKHMTPALTCDCAVRLSVELRIVTEEAVVEGQAVGEIGVQFWQISDASCQPDDLGVIVQEPCHGFGERETETLDRLEEREVCVGELVSPQPAVVVDCALEVICEVGTRCVSVDVHRDLWGFRSMRHTEKLRNPCLAEVTRTAQGLCLLVLVVLTDGDRVMRVVRLVREVGDREVQLTDVCAPDLVRRRKSELGPEVVQDVWRLRDCQSAVDAQDRGRKVRRLHSLCGLLQ